MSQNGYEGDGPSCSSDGRKKTQRYTKLPDRWLYCPRKSDSLIADKFLAFKTPLCDDFAPEMPIECSFTPKLLLSSMKGYKIKLGLWIDLTNTNRFYDRAEVESADCRYIKVKCRGHGEAPSVEQTSSFIEIVDEFIKEHPIEAIGVHCTHGFNRTGFLIVSYMVEKMDCSVEAALMAFAQARPPGIYKEDYIRELFRRYEDENEPFNCPPKPYWGDGMPEGEEDDDGNEEYEAEEDNNHQNNKRPAEDDAEQGSSPAKKKRKFVVNPNATFMDGVTNGIKLFTQQPRLNEIHQKIHKMTNWKSNGFPGSQPVSMDRTNMLLLRTKPYLVSWKADGTRYMMLIDRENEIYFFDRDFACFQVTGLRFPARKNLDEHIKNTLLDGEMVIDKVNGQNIPRYLVYDILRFEDIDVSKETFVHRLECIDKEIINPRHEAMKRGLIRKEREPFSIRKKGFWPIDQAHALLGEKFAKSLSHEPDGLIFQPKVDPYKMGRCDEVLKWKPADMNSIDFKLKIVEEGGLGMLTQKVGLLYVNGYPEPVAKMKITKSLREYNNKIVECKFENNQWVFMRERTDKSFPNHHTTAKAVFESIQNPVTKQMLLDDIARNRFRDDSEEMPPPRLK